MDPIQIAVAVVGMIAVLVLLHLAAKVAELFLYGTVMALGISSWVSIGGPWGLVAASVCVVPGGLLLIRALWRIRRTQPKPVPPPPPPPKPATQPQTEDD